MRMWMINPKMLCRTHLLGEHNELHKFRPNFVKKKKMDGRIGQIFPKSMKTRHFQLEYEMIKRGYKHNSPYEMPDISYLGNTFDNTKINLLDNLTELMNRCRNCRRRILNVLIGYDEIEDIERKVEQK